MNDRPEEMLQKEKPVDQVFELGELLYRRFDPINLNGKTVHIDAIKMPDMSVNRSKYGPPEWALLDAPAPGWGVCKFCCGDIPAQLEHLGTMVYKFFVEHVPEKKNYPHSEVRMTLNGERVSKKTTTFAPDVHLRFRNRLRLKIRIQIEPAKLMA